MKNEALGYVSLFLGIGAVLAGIHFGTGGLALGWVSVVIGLALVGFAFTRMRAPVSDE
ncbi:MAG: hypothetical protein JST00_27490 [Deltaproteobacteria bacterium]|nr:hypothetical protein [Deltaproteobacteria bacterium]